MRNIVGPLLVAILVAVPASLSADEAADALHALFDEAWEYDLQEDPLWATHVGDHRWNDRLPEVTTQAVRRRLDQKREFLRRLEKINREALSPEDRIHRDIFARLLQNEIAEGEFETYLMPVTNLGGFHSEFAELPQNVPLATVQDYENYLARLRAFEVYVQQHIKLMREGLTKGLTPPAVALDGVDEATEAHIVASPDRSLLFEPLRNFPDSIDAADRARLTAAAQTAIAESVIPAYRTFLEFLRQEYLPAARDSIAASALPRGRELYRFRIRKFTTLDLTPEEVHQTGLHEVRRIRQEMEEVIRKTGFEGDFAAFLEHLRTDPQFYATTPEELLKEVAYILKTMDGKLPALFGKLPRMPYGIRPIPDYLAPKAPTAYYQSPAGDGTRAGFFYINTYNLKSRPLYELEALALHEAVPGHHLQLALQQELTGLPQFRRFAGFTAFIEGWALYAERLGQEVGFYQDPYRDFGRLSYEMWRACRLVVDTGIHYFGWTREQAIAFMAENTALSRHNIEAEVDRYIAWPGQAVAYKTGELKIRELRRKAEQTLGERFDVRAFHDVVLGSGGVPLDVLEANVEAYLSAASAKD